MSSAPDIDGNAKVTVINIRATSRCDVEFASPDAGYSTNGVCSLPFRMLTSMLHFKPELRDVYMPKNTMLNGMESSLCYPGQTQPHHSRLRKHAVSETPTPSTLSKQGSLLHVESLWIFSSMPSRVRQHVSSNVLVNRSTRFEY